VEFYDSRFSGKKELMASSHGQTSLKKNKRWECSNVTCVQAPVDPDEWQYLLETLAKELYDLSHQLQETHDAVPTVESSESNRSYSLHHPDETGTPTPVATPTGEDGAWNGKDPQRAA
jgi:hypothetical protein